MKSNSPTRPLIPPCNAISLKVKCSPCRQTLLNTRYLRSTETDVGDVFFCKFFFFLEYSLQVQALALQIKQEVYDDCVPTQFFFVLL